MNKQQQQRLLSTASAAKELGLSTYTLRKYGHPENGFLAQGTHWIKPGQKKNSCKGWFVDACRDAMTQKGYIFFDKN